MKIEKKNLALAKHFRRLIGYSYTSMRAPESLVTLHQSEETQNSAQKYGDIDAYVSGKAWQKRSVPRPPVVSVGFFCLGGLNFSLQFHHHG